MKKAIIFGISGQDGFYLNKLLQQNYVQITGVARNNEKWVKGDVSNVHEVEHLIKQIKPDYVFHFAAIPLQTMMLYLRIIDQFLPVH